MFSCLSLSGFTLQGVKTAGASYGRILWKKKLRVGLGKRHQIPALTGKDGPCRRLLGEELRSRSAKTLI